MTTSPRTKKYTEKQTHPATSLQVEIAEDVTDFFDVVEDDENHPDSPPPEQESLDPEPTISEPTVSEPMTPATATESTMFGLIDLLLKNQLRLDHLTRQPQMQRELIPRLLAIGLIGYTIFGTALAVVFCSAEVWPNLIPLSEWLKNTARLPIHFVADSEPWSRWLDGSALKLIAAFTLGLIGAIGVCLPSFYFYGLLAGVRTTMLQVTTNALKGMASGAVAVVGALPIYFAVVLGLIVFHASNGVIQSVCFLGLALPFIAGLYGTHSLYLGFVGLVDTITPDRRCRRECFLRRLIFSWSVCFTAITPVMIFTLWEYMGR